MLVRLDQDRPVATLEEMPVSSVPTVEGLRVHAVQVAHAAGEVRLRGADEQVVVVAHQAVGEAAPGEALERFFEDLQEALPVRRVAVHRSALVASGGEVVDAVCDLESQRSCHLGERSARASSSLGL